MKFETLRIDRRNSVADLVITRADSSNAFNLRFWEELPEAVQALSGDDSVKVIVLKGEGRHFSAGADLELLEHLYTMSAELDAADSGERLRLEILRLQRAISSLEEARVPVIAAIQGACIGAGLDLIAACDLRFAEHSARFSLKEVDYSIVADVGALQRLQAIIGFAALAELSYTGDSLDAEQAKSLGLVTKVFPTKDELYLEVSKVADKIASKSGLTIRGIKRNLLYSRDHSVADGLDYVATWNAFALVNRDGREALNRAREQFGRAKSA